ncbi:MAG: rod-binding protein [Lachnospiraceae bacterium]|nr:rod-binding protein [Lachnospiraceae bacterium]
MGISIGNDYSSAILQVQNEARTKNTGAAALEGKLSASKLENASDEELMDVCKSFEAYLLEQVLTKTKKSIVGETEEDKNPYMAMFGDRLYQSYAEQIADRGDIGIAQKLYEAMKRDYGHQIKEQE